MQFSAPLAPIFDAFEKHSVRQANPLLKSETDNAILSFWPDEIDMGLVTQIAIQTSCVDAPNFGADIRANTRCVPARLRKIIFL